MSNNVTRKGLAFGALVALTSSVIAGAPAQAAGEINLAATAGTSYNTFAGASFTLEASFAPGFAPAAASQLKYVVTTDGSAVKVGEAKTSAADAVTALATATLTNNSVVVNSARTVATERSFLAVQMGVATDTESVTVTAFADANNNGALDSGEWNTVRTLGFKKLADIVPTVTLTAPNTGDTSVSAAVNWGDFNTDMFANEGVNFAYNDGSAQTAIAGTYNSSTSVWEKTGITNGLASATTVSAQAKIGTDLLGSAVTATATARTIATITGGFAATNDTKTISSVNYVRANKNFSVTAVVKDGASTPAAVAGVAVVAKVSTSATLSGTAGAVKSIAVNGGTPVTTGSANFATVNLTSGADGSVKVDLATVGLADGDTVTVVFTAQNLTATVATTQEADLTYSVTDASAAPIVATNKNVGVELTYNVKDQFGVASAATNQRIAVAATNATAGSTQFVPVAAGVAKFTVTPATDSTADVVVTSTLDSSATNSSTQNVTWTTGASTGITNTLKIRAAAFTFSTAPAIDAAAGINGAAWTSAGDQKQTITQLDLAGLNSTTSVVNVAAGVVYAKLTFTGSNAGESITVSGTDVYVAFDGGTASANTATKIVQTAANTVYVAANTVGTKTITFSNGTETKTVDVKFASAAVNTGTTLVATSAQATAANFAVAVAAAAQAGRSIDATVTVTDKWGNPVAGFDVTASVSGVASVNGGFSASAETDANGKATVKLTAGINDLGDAVVTFSDNDVNTATNVTAVAKTVVFGQTDGYIDVLNGKRASVTWSMAKGKRVAFYLDGVRKYNFVQTGDAELNLQFNLKKGTHNIKLVIGGVIVDDITVKITK